jgi:hypothetical protein
MMSLVDWENKRLLICQSASCRLRTVVTLSEIFRLGNMLN